MALAGTEHHPHAAVVLGAAIPPAGSPNHAYVFHGPSGVGKRTVATAFAAELLAEGSPDPDSARARVVSRAHPDLTWVRPSGAHELLVEDIDEPVVAAASRTPFEARRRVFVIERADTMNETSANRMLKTLEEPASFVHIVLLTDRPSELLPTIASRCQPVRFDPLPVEEIARRLEAHGVAPEQAAGCARLALGDGGRALRLASNEGPSLRAAAEGMAGAAMDGTMMSAQPWTALLAAATQAGESAVADADRSFADALDFVSPKDRRRRETEHRDRSKRLHRRAFTKTLDLGLELTGLWFRDLACVAHDAPGAVHHTDRAALLRDAAAGREPGPFRTALELVEDTRARLPLNVNEELACEALGSRLERLLAE